MRETTEGVLALIEAGVPVKDEYVDRDDPEVVEARQDRAWAELRESGVVRETRPLREHNVKRLRGWIVGRVDDGDLARLREVADRQVRMLREGASTAAVLAAAA
jgi:hypothetical protein